MIRMMLMINDMYSCIIHYPYCDNVKNKEKKEVVEEEEEEEE